MAETAAPASADALPLGGTTHKSSDTQGLHLRAARRKRSDPFLALDVDVSKLSDLQVKSSQATPSQEGKSDSLLMDLLLTPLNMIAFILSLSVVDYRQRQWRLSQHSSRSETLWYRVTHWAWLHAEPYQDFRDGTWKHKRPVAVQSAPGATFQGWSTQKQHRQIAKMQVSDAFAMRGRVVVAMLLWGVIAVFGFVYVARRLYGWASGQHH